MPIRSMRLTKRASRVITLGDELRQLLPIGKLGLVIGVRIEIVKVRQCGTAPQILVVP